MKKIILLIISIVLVLALAACGGDTTCTSHVDADQNGKCDSCDATVAPEGGEGNGGGATGADLVLVTGTKTGFAVVTGESLSSKAEGYVNDFIKTLNRYYLNDQDLKTNYDAPGFDDAVEIIFGSATNRGDAFKRDEHYLGYKGFSIEVIGNKLFVLGGGDKGYQEAIKYLEETLFDLEGYADVIDELVIPAGTKYESIPTDYDISEFTINNTPISEFFITYTDDAKIAKTSATILQDTIYKQTGTWVPYVALNNVTDDQKVIYVEFTKGDAERTTDNGFTLYVKGGDLHIECEFENKFEEMIYSFIDSKLSSAKVKISSSYTYSKDVRNIYYKDFGAVGDGLTDDFFAIKECHEYANKWGHTVNGTKGHTYYIGAANGKKSIPVKTDTYWNLCSFIWDDRDIPDPGVSGSGYAAPIFEILPDKPSYSLSGSKLPVTSIPSGATSIGDWKPGEKVMVSLYDNTKRHYIRYGSNENNGTAQTEIVIVYPDGSIDPTTPVQWDYSTLSKMTVYPVDDAPIVFSGGYKGQNDNYDALGKLDNYGAVERAIVYTYFNDAPSAYNYFGRNIQITRSNTTVKNIQHYLYDEVEQSAPYNGFITITTCADVVVEGMLFQKQRPFSTTGASGSSVSMGSYEMNANTCNNIVWRHCRQSNFFEPDGSTKSRGNMGTNYCKNLKFEDMVTCSFDAHCGLYNGTIIDSICEHLNFIGAGTIYYKDVTVYTDGNHAGIVFRSDYGSTWNGNVIIDGLTLKSSYEDSNVSIFSATYTNHYFGYTCYLPTRIELNNIKYIKYGYKMENGVRTEWQIEERVSVSLFKKLEGYKAEDISDPDAVMSAHPNDWKQCNCAVNYNGTKSFKDTNGDGRCDNDRDPDDGYTIQCWGFEKKPDTTVNANPYVATEEIYITNCGNLKIVIPSTEQFKNTKVYIDGVLQP